MGNCTSCSERLRLRRGQLYHAVARCLSQQTTWDAHDYKWLRNFIKKSRDIPKAKPSPACKGNNYNIRKWKPWPSSAAQQYISLARESTNQRMLQSGAERYGRHFLHTTPQTQISTIPVALHSKLQSPLLPTVVL